MTTTAITKADANAIRKEIKEIVEELPHIQKQLQQKIVRLSNLVHKVQGGQLFREWINPETKKQYTAFEDWIRVEVKESKASVYRFIGVKEHLKLPDKTLELIGRSRCFELVRIAKEKPAMLQRFVKAIEKNPELPHFTLQQMVTNALSGSHFDSGEYERLDFAVKIEDMPDVNKALAVMQAMDPVKNPDMPSGRGVHLVNFCNDYLSKKEPREVLKRLEKAGAFDRKNGNTNFKMEE